MNETGFAVIQNPPISYQLVTDVIDEWRAFFKTDEKFKYELDPESQTGFYPFMMESAKGNEAPNLMEYYHIKMKYDLPPGFSPKTKQLYQAGIDMALELARMLQQETPKEIRETFPMGLDEMCVDSNISVMRVLHYPKLDSYGEGGVCSSRRS